MALVAAVAGHAALAVREPARAARADTPAAGTRFGPDNPNLLPQLEDAARARWRDGDLNEAVALRRRALAISIAAFGTDSVQAAAAMMALGAVYIDRRRYLDAEPLLILAARTASTSAPPDDTFAAQISAGLARVALAKGETERAIDLARQATGLARRAAAAPVAEPLRALGAALAAAERFEEAEAALHEALAADVQAHGATASETARSQSQLANLYLRWKRPRQALTRIAEAAAIDRRLLGPAHPFIADGLHDLGLAYEALERGDVAQRAFRAALAKLDAGSERDTPRVAYIELELSRLYRRLGDDAAAEAVFRDARRILNKAEAEERRRERRV